MDKRLPPSDKVILGQIDKTCKQGDFFPFIHDWHNLFGPCRLVAFHAPDEWLITIQSVTYSNREGDFVTYLWAFGNTLSYTGLEQFDGRPLRIPVPKEDWCPYPPRFSFRLDDQLHD